MKRVLSICALCACLVVIAMKYPTYHSQNRKYRVSVPKMDGGVNVNDALHLVRDNQLTDCNNVWFKDGALRTRPGLWSDVSMKKPITYYDPVNPVLSIKSVTSVLGGAYLKYSTPIEQFLYTFYQKINPNGSFDGGRFPSPEGHVLHSMLSETANLNKAKYGELLMFVGENTQFSGGNSIYGVSNLGDIQLTTPYIPLVLVNGKPSTSTNNMSVTGTFYEGFNLLTPKFKCTFTSDNNGIYYALPQKSIDYDDVSVSYINSSGNKISYTITAGSTFSANDSAGNRVNINRAGGYIWWSTGSTPIKLGESGIQNNVTVIAQKFSIARPRLICGMMFNTWYGGDRSGHGGGTRLFVSGNPKHPNLVHWSDVNNPLYFPENNFAYIGGDSQKVTGFGKQGDMLVIFKEREMYYANYVAGQPYTADDVISGKVTDVAAMSATFPITPINAQIGCDVPDTIQLCANKLVWMNSNGKVYTLVSMNQWSERNVRELGQNISAKILEHGIEERRAASAADCDGHYYLLVGSKIYLLDYDDNSFQYYSSYGDDKKVQRGVVWFVWDVSLKYTEWAQIIVIDNNVVLCGKQKADNNLALINYVFKGKTDIDIDIISDTATEKPIPCMIQTKVFDFGYPERHKAVPVLYFGIGLSDGSEGITTTYLTDVGDKQDPRVIANDYPNAVQGTVQCIRERKLTPFLNRIQRFGIKMESVGNAVFDNMVIQYSLYGGGVR